MKNLRGSIFRAVLAVTGLCLLIAVGWNYFEQETVALPHGETGTLEKMIVGEGQIVLNLDLNVIGSKRARTNSTTLTFDAEPNSFFTIMAFNDEFRGAMPSTMRLITNDTKNIPENLKGHLNNLMLENAPFGSNYQLQIKNAESGFHYFNIEGHSYEYEPTQRQLNLTEGRLLLADEFAEELGITNNKGIAVGDISLNAKMRVIESAHIVNNEIVADTLPALSNPEAGTVPGPDVVVGDLYGLAQFGSSSGGRVGLAVATDSCNFGTVDLNWFALPNNDHPVIPQNLYRMSGGPNNDERFEQVGQSHVKHAFTALTQNLCALGCNGVGGSRLGSGCSDPYEASLNAGPNLGSRAWINPFTGFFPRGDSATPPNQHTSHSHNGTSHRILTEISDLNTTQNPGASYYAEAQYVTPHEYKWCTDNPGQCNMYNNASYRRYNVSGTNGPFSFSPVGATVRAKPAINAWPGATFVRIEPDAGNDGVANLAYKVTNPSEGVWRYEYLIHNENLDRAFQMLSIPKGDGVVISNVGFHAPPQHPGWAADGTVGSAGYSSEPWNQSQANNAMTWSSETFAQNPNANAIRWGTMYNFRFDSNRPPVETTATIGFFKTGAPITVQVQGPSPVTSSTVIVGGRVLNVSGAGVRNSIVTITDSKGVSRNAITSTFGYYSFSGLVSGESYTVSISDRRLVYAPQEITPSANILDLNFLPAVSLTK